MNNGNPGKNVNIGKNHFGREKAKSPDSAVFRFIGKQIERTVFSLRARFKFKKILIYFIKLSSKTYDIYNIKNNRIYERFKNYGGGVSCRRAFAFFLFIFLYSRTNY